MAEQKSTLETLSSILGDVIDIFSLGKSAIDKVNSLSTQESKDAFTAETESRAKMIEVSRKK